MDGRSKEAEIKFESSSAASTAVLLNNALVEGRNISVELLHDTQNQPDEERTEDSSASAHNRNDPYVNGAAGSSASVNSKLSELASQAKSVASQVSTATKDLNAKYDITGKLKGAYDSAAVTTAATFEKLDAQYDLKGKSSKAVEATKSGISSMYRQISGLWGTPQTTSTASSSPRTESPKQ